LYEMTSLLATHTHTSKDVDASLWRLPTLTALSIMLLTEIFCFTLTSVGI